MSQNAIKDRLKKQPFEAFRLRMSSGDTYEVRHPEMAWVLHSGLYVAQPDETGIFDRAAWCSFLHVASVEPLEAESTNPHQ